MLKGENCPISKNAMALIQAEIKRTGAISTRAKARQEAKAKAKAEQEAKEKAEAEEAAKPKQIVEAITAAPLIEQYQEMKKKHPDAVLLFRCGDVLAMMPKQPQMSSASPSPPEPMAQPRKSISQASHTTLSTHISPSWYEPATVSQFANSLTSPRSKKQSEPKRPNPSKVARLHIGGGWLGGDWCARGSP